MAPAEGGQPAPAGELVGDHVDVDVLGGVHRGLPVAGAGEEAGDTPAAAGAEDELGGVVGAGEGEQRGGDVVADDHVVAAAQALDELPLLGEGAGGGAGQAVAAGDVDGEQVPARRPVRDAGGASDQGLALGAAGEGDHDAFAGLPDPVDVVAGPVVAQALVDPPGHPEQGELAQGGEVADPEVVRERRVHLLRLVDVAVGHPAAQRLGGHVDEFDLVGPAHHLVRDGLALRDPGDLLDDVVQRLQVLDVDRGDDVDPGVQQLLDVLPALAVPPAGDVGVRQFVHQDHRGLPPQHRVEVHLLEVGVPVGAVDARHDLQAVEHRLGVAAPVALDPADDDVRAPVLSAPGLVQHPVGLADTGSGTEVHPQPTASVAGAGGEVAGHGRCSFRSVGEAGRLRGEHGRPTRAAGCVSAARVGPVTEMTD